MSVRYGSFEGNLTEWKAIDIDDLIASLLMKDLRLAWMYKNYQERPKK